MLSKRLTSTALIVFGLFLFGCVQQGEVVHVPAFGDPDEADYRNTRSFGEQGYYATIKYNPSLGTLRLEFTDQYGFPQKLIRKNKIKAVLTLPGEEPREFYLMHPYDKKFQRVNIKQRNLPRSLPSTDYFYVEHGWLKNISSYDLKIWIPIKNKTYVVEYSHAE